MHSIPSTEPIDIGIVSDEPIRLEGLESIFDLPSTTGQAQLFPIKGSLEELLARSTLKYLVVDLHSSPGGLETLKAIRRARPSVRLVVIGPEGNDELVIESIMAGARAYLDANARPETVRMAIDEVTSGSIWAPRRLLSRLIDRLLNVSDSSLANARAHLTDRERQVLELILLARSNREIARQLGIEERTVKSHVGRLMRKTGVENRIELSMRALSQSLLPQPGVKVARKNAAPRPEITN
jgi:DNA-binding NarL/FixJ family response regulator